MRIVIDGLPIRAASLAIIIENLLRGWTELDVDDEIHFVTSHHAQMEIPDGIEVHMVDLGDRHQVSRIKEQTFRLPRLCKELGADAVLGVLPTTTIAPLPCPRTIIAYDMRHELLPHQFTRGQRVLRQIYKVGWRQAGAICSISERTRQDLLKSKPYLHPDSVILSHFGADHVVRWPTPDPNRERYAVGFGQYGNKNVGLLLDAWKVLHERGEAMPLQLFGVPKDIRVEIEAHIARNGLDDVVTPLPWVTTEELEQRFAGAAMVVFPSGFEGFGIPAGEAMRLKVPLVISQDPALVEVAGGHATVMGGWGVDDLVDAVLRAKETTPEALEAAYEFAGRYTWSGFAAGNRETLQYAIAGKPNRR